MDSINFVSLKSDHSDDGKSSSNSPDSLRANAALNKETSFISQPNGSAKAPANGSAKAPANEFAKPFANGFFKLPIDQIPTKPTGPSVLLKHSVSSRRADDKQSLQKSQSAPYLLPLDGTDGKSSNGFSSNSYLTSTPNLFNSSNMFDNYDNILKMLQTPSKPTKSADNQTASSTSSGLPPAVLCRNVSFDYRHQKVNSSNVLKNVNLNCQIGSIYGLLGPSGCGMFGFQTFKL